MDFSKRSVQFHPCCPLCIGSSRQEIGTRYSNRSSPNISNNVSNGSHENTVSLYLFPGLVTGRNHVDDHTSLTWSSTVSHVLQDPQHLCIGTVCTCLCVYRNECKRSSVSGTSGCLTTTNTFIVVRTIPFDDERPNSEKIFCRVFQTRRLRKSR